LQYRYQKTARFRAAFPWESGAQCNPIGSGLSQSTPADVAGVVLVVFGAGGLAGVRSVAGSTAAGEHQEEGQGIR
jgi:hypothetical protein